MFCENCGNKLPDTAEFCPNCGKGVSTAKKEEVQISDTEVQLKVKPTFKFLYMSLPTLIWSFIAISFTSVAFLVINVFASLIIFIVFSGIMLLIIFIMSLVQKKQYDSYCFDFYKTKVIYKDSFLNISEKEVKYKYIREVTMRQTFIQRFFNLGNVILFTNAETGYGNGITISNVENVQEIYKQIKTVIDI